MEVLSGPADHFLWVELSEMQPDDFIPGTQDQFGRGLVSIFDDARIHISKKHGIRGTVEKRPKQMVAFLNSGCGIFSRYHDFSSARVHCGPALLRSGSLSFYATC